MSRRELELTRKLSELSKPSEPPETVTIYIFGTEATAEAFKMTAYHFGYEAARTGSALEMSTKGYHAVIAKTYAAPAAIVAEVTP